MPKRSAALACAAFGCTAVGLVLATVGPATTGCTTHQCDQTVYDWDKGFMLDEDTYVSNDLDQTWLDYQGNTTIQFRFPPAVAGRILEGAPEVDIGTDPTPNSGAARAAGGNFSQAAGQLAIFNELNTTPDHDGADGGSLFGGGFVLTNASCAQFFAHVVVHFAPRVAGTSDSLDGGIATGAGADATLGVDTGPLSDAATADVLSEAASADAGADGSD